MIDITQLQKKLEEEREKLVKELGGLGRKNPDDPTDWEATGGVQDSENSDPNDVADKIEEFQERSALEQPLEKQLHDVEAALKRMEAGTYGVCTVGGENHSIEDGRISANPSAQTCVAHIDTIV